MDFGRIIGSVVATVKDPSLKGIRLAVVQPLDELGAEVDRPLVAVDTAGQAAIGEHVFYVTGADAMMVSAEPRPLLPVDAAVVGILHDVHTPLSRRGDETPQP
jgi:ethanolamine utilization protein EutN